MESLCCCSSMFKPKYQSLVRSILHPKKGDKASKNNFDNLIFHVTSKNADFDNVGHYTLKKFNKYHRYRRYDSCARCLELFKNLINTPGSECLTIYMMEMVDKSIHSPNMTMNELAVRILFGYCRERSVNIYAYPMWKSFVEVLKTFSLNSNPIDETQQCYKKIGLAGIYALIHTLKPQSMKKELWTEDLTSMIILSLMMNFQQNPTYNSRSSSTQSSRSWKFDSQKKTFTTVGKNNLSDDSICWSNENSSRQPPETPSQVNTSVKEAKELKVETILMKVNPNDGSGTLSIDSPGREKGREDYEPVNAQFNPWNSKNDVLSKVVFISFLSKLPNSILNTVILQIFDTIQKLNNWNNKNFSRSVFSTICESIDESQHRTLIRTLLTYVETNASDYHIMNEGVSLITDCIQYISMTVIVAANGPEIVDRLLTLFVNADSAEISVREMILNALSTFASHLQSSLMNEPMERILSRIPLPEEAQRDPSYLLEHHKNWTWTEKQRETSYQFLICLKAIVHSFSASSTFVIYQLTVFRILQNGLLYPCAKCREVLLKILLHLFDQNKIAKSLSEKLKNEFHATPSQLLKISNTESQHVMRNSMLEFDIGLFLKYIQYSFLLSDNRKTHYRSLSLLCGVLSVHFESGASQTHLSRTLFKIQDEAWKQCSSILDDEWNCIDSEFLNTHGSAGSDVSIHKRTYKLYNPINKIEMDVPLSYSYLISAVTAGLLFVSFNVAAKELVDLCMRAIKKRQEFGLTLMLPQEVMLMDNVHFTPPQVIPGNDDFGTCSTPLDTSFNQTSSPVCSSMLMKDQIVFNKDSDLNDSVTSSDSNIKNPKKIYLSHDLMIDSKSFLGALRNLGFADHFKTDRSATFNKDACTLFASSRNLNKSGESLDNIKNVKKSESILVTYYTLKDAASVGSLEFDSDDAVSLSKGASTNFKTSNVPNLTDTINQIEKKSSITTENDMEIDELLNSENTVPHDNTYTF